MGKKIVVTVGSTQFDELISLVDSVEFVKLAKELGYTEIIAQIGAYQGEIQNLSASFRYAKPDEMKKKFQEADLVIGHAGAGTIMEVLQLGKPILVVVNDNLMQNHQTEVAQALSNRGILQMSSVSDLLKTFSKNAFEPHKLELSCDGVVSAIEDHFGFKTV